ncbi:GPW/gp25 family protein, partial [Streptomyces misionensis]|uniref:GPW/gp25 family protein n=1 Tax=Streptomyces misionensis TaxID=67331 RepID=UPI0021BD438F
MQWHGPPGLHSLHGPPSAPPRRTGSARPAGHIHDLGEQLLFTGGGERVMRPDFGCGLLDLVFAPTAPELVSTL